MWQPQFMSRCGHDMTVTSYCFYYCLALLLLISHFSSEVNGTTYSRYRSRPYNLKKTVQESTESSSVVPDPIAVENHQQNEDYGYGNLELNLVRPNKEPHLHAQISTKYTTSIISDHTPTSSLEDAETAEEYVSKAIQRYGSRLKEPIRIEPEPDIVSESNSNDGGSNFFQQTSSTTQPSELQQNFISQQAQQPHQDEDRSELDSPAQSQYQLQEQQQQQQQQQQHQQQQQQQQQQAQYEYFQTKQAENANIGAQQNVDSLLGQQATAYEKELQSTPYQVYEHGTHVEASQAIDRNYRAKYAYQPTYENSESDSDLSSDKIRVSASTEIPKAEIMKQIEKSVIRYMQELEAEGKIITAPKEPKTYYKFVTVPVENKRASSTTTTRPKYRNSDGSSSYESSQTSSTSSLPFSHEKTTRYQTPKSAYKYQDHSENISSYQPAKHGQQNEAHDSLAPNIEFVYKIKSRAPLQTATVKTLSKPYTLAQKGVPEQFDHSAVLKSMEEFDLRHVVTTKDMEDHGPSTSDKFRVTSTEYRKMKDQSSPNDYKGYPGYFAEPAPIQTGQEMPSDNPYLDDAYPFMSPYQYKARKEHPSSHLDEMPSNPLWDQPRGHSKPLLPVNSAEKPIDFENYNYVKYNNHPDNYKHSPPHKQERDRDSFHIVHKHVQRHALGPRGKRGGIHHSSLSKPTSNRNTHKDTGASIALRPPPKV